MLNCIHVMGRLTADPELRHTQAGVAVTTFRLAVSRDFKNRDTGEREADFIPVVCWRSTSEFAARYVKKGQLVAVEGRLQIRDYTDKDGVKRTIAEIICENLYPCERRERQEEPQSEPQEDLLSYRYRGTQLDELSDDGDTLPF